MGISKAGSIDAAVVITASLVPVLPTWRSVLPTLQLDLQAATPGAPQQFVRRRHEHV